jgi:anti-sigma factor RsiW
MTHESASRRIGAYLDNELDTTGSIELLEHAKSCEICKASLAEAYALRKAILEELSRYSAPDKLRAALLSSIASEHPAKARTARSRYTFSKWSFAIPAALAIGLLTGMFAFDRGGGPSDAGNELILESIRALKSGHVFDVASSDKHTVKPWFAGKVDLSPFVPDLAGKGYPLIGGRTAYFEGHDAAALIYMKGNHYIQLYEWPQVGKPTSTSTVRTSSARGYSAEVFSLGVFECCAVSDISLEDLKQFRQTVLTSTPL